MACETPLLAVNTTKAEANEYMDTGYLAPFVVPPNCQELLGKAEVSVWNVGFKTNRVLIGKGMGVWKRLSPNPDLWLYVVQVPDMEVIDVPFTRDVLMDVQLALWPDSMLLPDGICLHCDATCAADMGKTDSIYAAGVENYRQQIAKFWFDTRLHLSCRYREKINAGDMTAAEWWQMAGGNEYGGPSLIDAEHCPI